MRVLASTVIEVSLMTFEEMMMKVMAQSHREVSDYDRYIQHASHTYDEELSRVYRHVGEDE